MTNFQFEYLKGRAIEIWASYDNSHSYAVEKISKIINLENSDDSILLIYGMFDGNNQSNLLLHVPGEIGEEILKVYHGK